MLKAYPKFARLEIEDFYNTLSKEEQDNLSEYLQYREGNGITTKEKLSDTRRYFLQLRYIVGKDLGLMDLKELTALMVLINTSHLSKDVKAGIKADIKNYLKRKVKDWSSRFNNLDIIKYKRSSNNEEKLNSKTILEKKDIEKLVKTENRNFYKAFLLTQYEAGLRTKETRFLKWKDLTFNVDGDISEVLIYSTKTSKARTIYIKEATFYLQKLAEEQENTNNKGVYVFHAHSNKDKPIDKATINLWFKKLSKKALGREVWNYVLRHSRATELYRLARQNKISKDTAIDFMGHSEDMSRVYSHFDKNEIKIMLKNQVYKLEELPPEQENELKKEVKELRATLDLYQKDSLEGHEQVEQALKKMQENLERDEKLILQMVKENKKLKEKLSS